MRPGGPLRLRLSSLAATSVLVTGAFASIFQGSAAQAQTPGEKYDIVDELIDAFQTEAGQKFTKQFTKGQPQVFDDPEGDYIHPTGQKPGYTPKSVDIVEAVKTGKAFPGADEPEFVKFLTDKNHGGPWCASNGFGTATDIRTFCDRNRTGNPDAFTSGVFVAGAKYWDTVPFPAPKGGGCEIGFWWLKQGGGPAFAGSPGLPNDPGKGMNSGLVLFWDGRGISELLSVRTSPDGKFRVAPTEAVGAIYKDQYAVFVPLQELGVLTRATYHIFCSTNQAARLDPKVSGGDILGPVNIDFNALATLIFTAVAPMPSASASGSAAPSESAPGGMAETGGGSNLRGLYWGLVIAGIVLFVAGLICCICCWIRRRDEDEFDEMPPERSLPG